VLTAAHAGKPVVTSAGTWTDRAIGWPEGPSARRPCEFTIPGRATLLDARTRRAGAPTVA